MPLRHLLATLLMAAAGPQSHLPQAELVALTQELGESPQGHLPQPSLEELTQELGQDSQSPLPQAELAELTQELSQDAARPPAPVQRVPHQGAAVPIEHRRIGALCQESTTLLGFSRNERTLALSTEARCARLGGQDVLTYVDVLDAQTGKILATAQKGYIWHTAGGKRRLVRSHERALAYPALAEGLSEASLNKVSLRARWEKHRHTFQDASVRLKVMGRRAVHVHVAHQDLQVESAGQKELPLQFAVIGRLADGKHIDLAHFNRPARVSGDSALSLYYAPPGHRVLLLWRVGAALFGFVYTTPPDARFASNDVGAVNVMSGNADEIESLFKKMHPDSTKTWDENVGEL